MNRCGVILLCTALVSLLIYYLLGVAILKFLELMMRLM